MKKFIKIFLIALVSFLSLLILTIGIAWWIVFTPERITPIVRKQAGKFITCQSEIGEVELTFLSTYPELGLKVSRFALINPVAGAPSDTLVRVEELIGIVDAVAWLKRKEMKLLGLELSGGSINVYSDSLGNTNYDIILTDTTASPERDTEKSMPVIDIRKVVLDDVNLAYIDLSSKLNAIIRDLNAEIAGSVTQDGISGRLEVSRSGISFEYDGEKYLDQASIHFDIPVDFVPSRQFIQLKNANFSINDLSIGIDGTLENDTLNKTLHTDLRYALSSWPLETMVDLVPPSFHSQLEGIEGGGLLTSEGSIKGPLNDSLMPLMDIHLKLENGIMKYEGFPLPLHDVLVDINLYSDLKTDSLSFLKINNFEAKTARSGVKVEGLVNQLFSDIYCDLAMDSRLRFDEFAPMIPDSLNVKLTGNTSGKVRAAFSLEQVKKMQLEKMKISGSMTLSDFDANYDSLSLNTDRTRIDFALPNRKASANNTGFAFARISSDHLSAAKLESYQASMQNASISLETSDARDTTRIPDVLCSFSMDAVSAGMDSMSLSLAKPGGNVSISPRPNSPDQPRITLSYSSKQLETIFGQNSAVLEEINLESDILNDNSQEDIFLKWLAKGFVDLNRGSINLSGFPHPIEIPAVKMNFDPETFAIEDASLKIDRSDFRLSGNANNILSYFRGDSLLRGRFSFVSDTTDITQIMALTSGLGSKDTTEAEQEEATKSDTVYTGPYMVPMGIDVLLNTNIKTANFGQDTASNINGDVRIKDGVLVLDELSFETPAAKMQATAMYRTPRKNHLYVGLDYHMLDVEIEELLTMIPDIDTLMPMLRSFKGKGEFHLAVETYTDSLYNIKKSTLRGASSINGSNLVLMDGETFSEIAQKLRFSRKAENKVDSLSAEFTIFRNEIDIYPFLIVMDKYKAVVAGRHNFDMSFDYHVSLVDSPVPIKLGIDLKGNMDDLSVNLAKCEYAELYRPVSRGAVENKQLELRKLIREILTQKVKD